MTVGLATPVHWVTQAIHVELVGCGGTGSAMLDELFRMHSLLVRLNHPGLRVRAWDGDRVSEANIGRQRFWPADVGWNKAEVLISRYNNFGDVNWAYESALTKADMKEWRRQDLIISCVDDPKVRVMIASAGRKSGNGECIWIDTGNDADSGQVVLGHWKGRSDKAGRLPHVVDLYPTLRKQKKVDADSCSTEEALLKQDFGINQRVAAEASGLLWRLLRHGGLNRHGSFVYQEHGEVIPLPICRDTWASFRTMG